MLYVLEKDFNNEAKGQDIERINMKEAYKGTIRLMLVLTLVSLFACGGSGSDTPEYSCYPSQIFLTYPEDNETDVAGYGIILVRFEELMDDSTINESTFTLEDDTGNIVAGTSRNRSVKYKWINLCPLSNIMY